MRGAMAFRKGQGNKQPKLYFLPPSNFLIVSPLGRSNESQRQLSSWSREQDGERWKVGLEGTWLYEVSPGTVGSSDSVRDHLESVGLGLGWALAQEGAALSVGPNGSLGNAGGSDDSTFCQVMRGKTRRI